MKRSVAVVLLAALSAAVFFYARSVSAADTDLTIYFENSTLPLKSQSLNRIIYLPLSEIVSHLGLSYTDATVLGTYTLRNAANAELLLIPNSAVISINNQPVFLQNPIRRESGKWWVPLDFLSQGLSRLTNIEFRYRPGTARVFAGNVTPAQLVMNAQALGPVTRLTLRSGAPLNLDMQRDSAQRTVLVLKGKPVDPLSERLDYKDRLVQTVSFDDSDGAPKILVGTTDDVREVRVTSSPDNLVYFVDFIRETAGTEAAPPPPPTTSPTSAKPDVLSALGGVRVIAIDPGHGGIETGTSSGSVLEKDLTLSIARRLRTALQSRMGAMVLLTRDSDVSVTSEARSAIANSNRASLLISLHVGYSPEKTDVASSIYVMNDKFGNNLATAGSTDRLFLPWYLAYRSNKPASDQLAKIFREDLTQAFNGWKFSIRSGPIGVLASAAMPAVAVEVGNVNNPIMTDGAFQTKLAATIAAATERFAEGRTTTAGRP
jgi:N-acetylmuramoyl-L-alanine amidase